MVQPVDIIIWHLLLKLQAIIQLLHNGIVFNGNVYALSLKDIIKDTA